MEGGPTFNGVVREGLLRKSLQLRPEGYTGTSQTERPRQRGKRGGKKALAAELHKNRKGELRTEGLVP